MLEDNCFDQTLQAGWRSFSGVCPGPAAEQAAPPYLVADTAPLQECSPIPGRPLLEGLMFVFLFDIDGTLLDSRGAGKAAFEAVLEDEFGIQNVVVNVPYAGRTDRAIVGDLFRLHGINDTAACWRRFLASYPSRLRETLPRYPGRVLPGVESLVGRLCQHGNVAVGLLTGNVRRGAYLKLAHYRLDSFFSFGGFGDRHVDRESVARDALSAAGRHLGAPPAGNQVVVVGDTPHDIRCGRAIGARTVAVATGGPVAATLAAESPDLLLDNLADAKPLLQWITSR